MTLVKICGITDAMDGISAARDGADLLGFVFHRPSTRWIDPAQARQVIESIRKGFSGSLPLMVGVFVNPDRAMVNRVVEQCGLDLVQLHGSEPPSMVDALEADRIRVIKAFCVRNKDTIRKLDQYRATAFLLDAFVPGELGGTGQRFDWTLAEKVAQETRVILAGGLDPDNVKEAIHTVKPWAVDVSSGVERLPGRKDHDRVRKFIERAKINYRGTK